MDENGELDTSLMNSDERAGWNELMEVIRMENQSPQWNIAPISPAPQMNDLVHASSSSTTSIIQKTTQNVMPNPTSKPFLRIVEQPATKALRFRYECEGRSAGSIPGVSSTPEHRTFPSIEIVNYDKKAIVIVSCVTKDPPYRPHPHKVVGRDGGGQKFENGYCEVTLDGPPLSAVFNNLGIQCVKRREVITSLNLRKSKNINPFKVPYPSNDQKPTYDLNVVRLCFQGFINPTGKQWEALKPEISEPVIDKKGVFELRICQLCKCSGKVNGGDRIILLCEKVDKNDIKIKFSEINDEGEIKWAAYGEFQQSNIHKQYAIVFKTPRYERTDITEAVKVHIQLERPSDGGLSEPLEFEYYPDPDSFRTKRFKYNKVKEELATFEQSFQSTGPLMRDINATANGNNLHQTNVFTTPQFKIEPAQSPDYYNLQPSPHSMTHSPIPQASPTGAGMQYNNLQTTTQNINQFLSTTTMANICTAQWNVSPITTSGGTLTWINNNQNTNQNTTNPFSLQSNIPIQANNNDALTINFDDMEIFRNIHGNAITDTPIGSDLPLFPESEERLTESGLLNLLDGQQLMEISNLSVSGET